MFCPFQCVRIATMFLCMQAFVSATKLAEKLSDQIQASQQQDGKDNGACLASYNDADMAGLSDCKDPEAKSTPILVSGAGHDAMVMSKFTKMAMLFVRCR